MSRTWRLLWLPWALLLGLLAVILFDHARGSYFAPVTLVPCSGAACEPGTRASWRVFSDAFQGRSGPFAPTDYCALSINYLRTHSAESSERDFIVDLMDGTYITVTPDADAVTITPGPRANPFRALWDLITFKPVGCHLSGWGIWPVMLFFLTIGWTQWIQLRATKPRE